VTERATVSDQKQKHAQTLNTDRTRLVKQRPRLIQRPVTSVTTFASVSFLTSGVVEKGCFNSSKMPESRLTSSA
jgi:hypothetical protein